MTEDEMAGWHHRLDGHEFQQTLGDGEGQGSLACCSPWGRNESDTIEQPNNKNIASLEEESKGFPSCVISSCFFRVHDTC